MEVKKEGGMRGRKERNGIFLIYDQFANLFFLLLDKSATQNCYLKVCICPVTSYLKDSVPTGYTTEVSFLLSGMLSVSVNTLLPYYVDQSKVYYFLCSNIFSLGQINGVFENIT